MAETQRNERGELLVTEMIRLTDQQLADAGGVDGVRDFIHQRITAEIAAWVDADARRYGMGA